MQRIVAPIRSANATALVDRRVGAEELDSPAVGAQHHGQHQQADVVLLAGSAGEDGDAADAAAPIRDQLAEVRAHLGRDRMLLRDRELAAVPRLTGPAQRPA